MATHEGRISALEEAVKTIKGAQIDPERIRAIEGILDKNEALSDVALAAVSSRAEEAHVMAMEARELVTQTNTLVAQMSQKIIDSIDARAKGKKLEARDWMFLFVAIVSAAGTIGALLR